MTYAKLKFQLECIPITLDKGKHLDQTWEIFARSLAD